MRQESTDHGWSVHDTAIWHTCDIAAAVIQDDIDRRPAVYAAFPAHWEASERMLASGGFQRFAYHAAGDGSYVHDSSTYFFSGKRGLALTAGLLAFTAAGNARRRRNAAAMAAPRWRPVEEGEVTISTHGVYFRTVHGLYPWAWAGFAAAEIMAPECVAVQGESVHGPASWIVRSVWAELIFVLWSFSVHPRHPQLLSGSWLPPGWRDRAQAAGYWPTNALTALARYRDGT